MNDPAPARKRILLTGAAGRIGKSFLDYVGDRYELRLGVYTPEQVETTGSFESIVFDIADLAACQRACRGTDTVIHLAGSPSASTGFYEGLLENNIKGVYNIFRAAKDQGCQRVVYASSNRVVDGYPPEDVISEDQPLRPLTMYGASKCFGEAVAHAFAFSEGLSSIVLRVGAFEGGLMKDNPSRDILKRYLTRRDMCEVLARCIEVENVSFAILNVTSNNREKRLTLSRLQEVLAYEPQDDAFELYGIPHND